MYVEYRSLSAPQLAALDRRTTFLLLPVSSTEQHGPHLPVGTDAIIGRTILENLRRLKRRKTRRSYACRP